MFFLMNLFGTAPKDSHIRRPALPPIVFVGFTLLGLLMLYAAGDLPKFADPESPPNVHVSAEYITDSFQETNTPNIVTSVLMDYRAFDTLMETAVIFTAGIACALLLRRNGE